MRLSPTTLSDSELVASVAGGDPLAEGALYEKYSERVFFLALSERHSREEHVERHHSRNRGHDGGPCPG